MDLRELINTDPAAGPLPPANERLVCSAKACRADATWALRWNNPKLHRPERRKVWLACDEHEVTLRDFLGVRGFYLDSVRPAELTESDG